MANYANLKSAIQQVIKTNGNKEITGALLQQSLLAMINSLGAYYQFIGIATPETSPGTPDQRVFYIGSAGTYPNFGPAVVPDGNMGVFYYDSGWHFGTVAFPIGAGTITETNLASSLVNKLFSTGYKFAGIATPSTNPGTPDQNVFYIGGAGTYSNFSNLVVPAGHIGALKYNGTWTLETVQVGDVNAVKFVEQTLTDTQKAQARTNIEAASSGQVGQLEAGKQDKLVSGENIKTVGGQSVLGEGNIPLTDQEAVKFTPQSLTDAQKAQARTNIEAASSGQVSQLEAKVSNIEVEDTESENKEIVILDDNEAEVVKVTEDGLSAKSLKVGATPVLTENDKLQAGDNITIEGNVISADFPYDKEDTTSPDDEQVWTSDDGTETYAKVDKDGVHAKQFYDLDGNTIKEKIETELDEKYDNEVAKVCNTKYNHSALARFINKYVAKDVDEWNQLTLMMCGDSIFGRQHSGATEMSPTLDVNTPGSTAIGYETGHFPPNMWVQNVPFKVLQALQFDEADVKYYNHTASEVTKTGSGWTDMFPAGADELRTVKTNVLGDSISLHFTGAYYAKVVISKYVQTSHLANVKVTVSENGGAYATPDQFGLTESHAHTNSGEYELRDFETIKFAQLVFGGFDTTKTYDLKVELTNSSYLNVWGFETWTRKRLNVVVSAEGGNVASSQINNPKRFYNENLNPDLCILDMPFLNDCGTASWYAWYKGKKVPTSAAIDTPNQYDFFYCDEAGTYTNFGGIVAVKGDYIEYDGSSWVLGSTKLNNMFNRYRTDLQKLMVMCKNIGVPMLVIMTHQSILFIGKPFLDDAADFMKLNAKEFGFASIDVYKYRQDLNLTNIWSDSTHLNDNGVKMYIDLISAVLNKEAEYVADGRAVIETGSFVGHSNGGNTSFGFVMKETPKVFLSNPSVTVTSVSKSGFNVSGNGSYDYFVKS